ncbi:MAG: DegT/DnrJ/EryC1/StrS family aminotransferase [candidate division WOR-3 bacterium]|nr:MAG: DegT/DnrJ/EryC1/StrS family aminotransferase [candidate division WOR-3 bacterium]
MKYKIPLFKLHYGKSEERAVLKVLRSKWISMGPITEDFETAFAGRLHAKHVLAVSSCTDALHLAMLVLGIGEGDEVIVPALTFVATVNAIRYVRATPVFADIKSSVDLTVDPDDVANKITPKTKAILVVHYGGYAADMDTIMALADKHGISVVEDAAHAPDADYKGKKLGAIGDIGCFSFFANKNITCAKGGAFVTNSDEYAQRARLLRSHGMTTLSYDRATGHAVDYDVLDLGYNYRIDDIRAAILLAQLERLSTDIDKRSTLVKEYHRLLTGIDEIILPFEKYPYRSSHYVMPVVLNAVKVNVSRDEIRRRLQLHGIQTSVHYPPVNRFDIYKEYHSPLPRTESVAQSEVTLPLYYSLETSEIEAVVESLKISMRE